MYIPDGYNGTVLYAPTWTQQSFAVISRIKPYSVIFGEQFSK